MKFMQGPKNRRLVTFSFACKHLHMHIIFVYELVLVHGVCMYTPHILGCTILLNHNFNSL